MNKTIVITGGSSGIGAVAARRLRERGEHVVITGRSPETKRLADEIGCDAYLVDYAKLSELRRFAQELLDRYPRIDVLVNNAGAIFGERRMTEDGHEMTLQVNHLAGFLLTNLLRERLEASKAIVINTASGAHLLGHLDLDGLGRAAETEARGPRPEASNQFNGFRTYAATKMMNILHAMEIARRFQGVSAASFHPGGVATRFAREGQKRIKWFYESAFGRLFLISPEKGADTLLWLLRGEPGKDWESGQYYQKRKPGRRSREVTPSNAVKLWEASERLIGP